MENISISLSESGADRSISEIRVDGVIDTLTAGELEEVIDSLLKRRRYKIVFDLAGVDYISSAGWGIFISHIKDVRANDGDIKLAGMVPNVYEIYELLEFDNVLQSFGTVDEARVRFESGAPDGAVKKKDLGVTRLTVTDQFGVLGASRAATLSEVTSAVPSPPWSDTESLVLRAVGDDPFASISEIRRSVNRHPDKPLTGWWRVFFVLKRHGLLSRRSRFHYVRRRH